MRSGILLRGRSPLGRRKAQTKALAACNAHQDASFICPKGRRAARALAFPSVT